MNLAKRDWVRKIRRYLNKFGIRMPRIPRAMHPFISDNWDAGFVILPVFQPSTMSKIPETWINTHGDYPKLLTENLHSQWVLWPAKRSKKSTFLGKDLEERSINDRFLFLNLPKRAIVRLATAMELTVVYNILNVLACGLFHNLPDAEWTGSNPFPEQGRCLTILHIKECNAPDLFRVCAYNAVATEKEIAYRPIVLFH